ncbi:MAG: hypothetical protein FJX75_27685 [Armatimonadetes bacterium]|nr:hypothetical protein [Armatimonadota bacterium]
MRRPLVWEITDDPGYRQALEWRERFRQVLQGPGDLGADLDEETRQAILKGYRLHLADLERRIEEYEASLKTVPEEEVTSPFPG